MQNKNHKSESACAFGETLVSVLYGEATEHEAKTFERHLDGCPVCTDEIAAFGTLRSAVSDWREMEFEPIALPNIVLPRENETAVSVNAEETSWAKSWRDFFSPANFGWQTAGVGFACLLILGFLFIYSTDLTKPAVDVAEALPASPVTATPEINSLSDTVFELEEKTVALNKQPAKAQNQLEEKTSLVSIRVGNKMPKHSETRANSNGDIPKRRISNRRANQKVKDLNILPAEAEDNTPRLTDLLEEIEPSN